MKSKVLLLFCNKSYHNYKQEKNIQYFTPNMLSQIQKPIILTFCITFFFNKSKYAHLQFA